MQSTLEHNSKPKSVFHFAKENGFNDSHMFLFHLMTSDIMNGMSQYKEGLQYAEKSEKTFLSQGYSKADRKSVV